MSITYEEALSTLESMFGAPWDREYLDLVLRHFQGHMENTVEAILAHGEQDPSILITNLKNGKEIEARDSELARQLAVQQRQHELQQQQRQAMESARPGRGVPTVLPQDFLRVPGMQPSTMSTGGAIDQDEALARMLQNEMYSQDMANRQAGGVPPRFPRASTMTRPSAPQTNSNQPPPILEHITELGQDAKKHLQQFAAQCNTGFHRLANRISGGAPATNQQGGAPSNIAAANETRSLLDDNNDDNGDEMELSFATPNR